MLQVPLFKDEQETVALQLAQQTAVPFRPLGNGVVQAGIEGGNGAFCQIFGQFFVVINQNDGDHRTGADIFVPDLVQFCQIAEVQRAQHGAPAVLCPDGGAVDPVAPVTQRRVFGAFGFSGFQPVQGKVRQDFFQLLLHHGVGIAGQLAEAVVGPDDHPVAQPDEHRGQGAFSLRGGFQGVGDGLDITLNLPVPAVAVHHIQQKQQQCHNGFHRSQQEMPADQRGGAEAGHHNKIHTHSGPQQLIQLSVHPETPP